MPDKKEVARSPYSIFYHNHSDNILELSWLESTSNMTDEDFQNENLQYAKLAENIKINYLLIDVRKFGHQFSDNLAEWRKAKIVPKYNNAGVEKMAFLHDKGFDLTNMKEMEEGKYKTRHFSQVNDVKNWFESK